MNNNTLLILCIIGSVVIGGFIGYFAFAQIFKEQFQQQDRLALSNFESINGVLRGTVVDVGAQVVTLEKDGIRFPLEVAQDALILIPNKEIDAFLDEEERMRVAETGRPILKEGTITEIMIGASVEAAVNYTRGGIFQTRRIMVSPVF